MKGVYSEDRTCKQCSLCKQMKPLDSFWKAKSEPCGIKSACIECESARQKKHRQDDLTRARADDRRKWLRGFFGLTEDDYDAILERQGGGCANCGTTTPGGHGRFHIDHDHLCCPGRKSCGKCIRGLLCHHCNTGLGKFNDDPEFLRRSADYIEKFRANNPELFEVPRG